MTKQNRTRGVARREFLAGAAATTFTMMNPGLVHSSEANSRIELGLIGCGGRGNWIADLFTKTGKYKVVACADYYQDQVDKFGEKFNIDPAKRYTTLSGYKRLLENKLDAVVIETPPYCHPEQAADAVDAGKHVFLAKPIAVDVPGCQSIAQTGKKATANKLVCLVDFQTRASALFQEVAKRVHNGDIGRLVCGEAVYPWNGGNMPKPETPEDRLRRWYCFLELSGDFIVEQSIHAIDVAAWLINANPIRAFGTGGRKNLRTHGNIWDHFNVTYWFPNDCVLSFNSVQVIPGVRGEIRCRMFGSEGVVDTDYYSGVSIRGQKPYKGGKDDRLYIKGPQNNIADFHRFITQGHYANETVAASVRSNLTAVLGRTAAYAGHVITWDEMMRANVRIEPDLSGLKS